MSNFRECHRCILYSQDRSEAPKRMVKVGPDIFLHAADSQVLEQIKSGQEFRQPPENFEDVQALACYLAAEKFSEGRELAKKIAARRAPVILQSSSLPKNKANSSFPHDWNRYKSVTFYGHESTRHHTHWKLRHFLRKAKIYVFQDLISIVSQIISIKWQYISLWKV